MHVLITGAHGFIGSELTRLLLRSGVPVPGAAEAASVRRLTLVDRVGPPQGVPVDPRVHSLVGDLSDPALFDRLVGPDIDLVVALGETLTAEAERDFDRALEVNLHGMLRLLEAGRQRSRCARLVYASSIAAYGGELPEIVGDGQVLTPQTTYGTLKAVNELLIADYARRGYVDGRVLRLPIIVVRPEPAGDVVSDRIGALVREPLAGRDVRCPLAADTCFPLASVQAAAEALRAIAGVPGEVFGASRSINLPSLSVRTHELVQMVQTIPAWRGWRRPVGQVLWEADPALQAIVGAWPRRFESELARRLGIVGDRSLPHLINRYIFAHLDPAHSARAAS
jgi:D-erythronate 2-dehydrogenase